MKQQNILLAEAQIENDTIAMDIANQRLKETKVTSPIDGVVSARTVQVGTIIASGINNIGGGTAALTLSDLSRLFVLASVDESDIGTIELGQKVEITADSYQGKKFEGKVVRIATKGKNTSNVVTFEVRVEVVSDNKALLKPEMTTNVSIIVADKKDVLILPLNALTRQGEKRVVTLAQETGQSKENHPVEVGISNGSEVEILSGVSEKDIVLVKEGVQDSQWSASSKQQKMPAPPPMMMMRPPGGGRSK
jgi:RND family efflux transporter MFP subunit